MSIIYTQTDQRTNILTPDWEGCSAESGGIISLGILARVGGPPGIIETHLCGVITSGVCITYECDPPAVAEWAAGNYIIQINILEIHEDLYVDHIWVCDWDETTFASVLSYDVTTHVAGTTGIFTAIMNRGTNYTPQDQGLSRPTFHVKLNGGTGTANIKFDRPIFTPIVAPVTGASPGTTRQPMTNQYHPYEHTRVLQ